MKYRFDPANHIHTLDSKPLKGTSTVVGVISKPLTWWASGKALELMGWTPTKTEKQTRLETAGSIFNEIRYLEHKQYLALLDKCYRNHKDSLDKSADKGIDLHAELERYVKYKMGAVVGKHGDIFADEIDCFCDWAEKNVAQFLWSEAHCYSSRLWTGGISDMGAILKDGRVAIGDFKSSKEAYTSHFIQQAGYVIALEENGLLDNDGNSTGKIEKPIDTIITFPFGATKFEPVFNKLPIERYKKGFENAVELYGLVNDDKEDK